MSVKYQQLMTENLAKSQGEAEQPFGSDASSPATVQLPTQEQQECLEAQPNKGEQENAADNNDDENPNEEEAKVENAPEDQGYEYYDEEEQEPEYDAEYYAEEEAPDTQSPDNQKEEEPKDELKEITASRFAVDTVSPQEVQEQSPDDPIDENLIKQTDQDLSPAQINESCEEQLQPQSDGRETADILKQAQVTRKQHQAKNGTNLLSSQDIGSKANLNLKKQTQSANINMISYQTANFGQEDLNKLETDQLTTKSGEAKKEALKQARQRNSKVSSVRSKNSESSIISSQNPSKMCASMSDIAATNVLPKEVQGNKDDLIEKASELISQDLLVTMNDTQVNWKVRTSTIDQIHDTIQDTAKQNPSKIIAQTEQLLDSFMKLLGDQNFKIVLTSLNIINLVLNTQQQNGQSTSKSQANQDSAEQALSSAIPAGQQVLNLGGYVPQLIKKLADSKNIIRQQASRALVTVYTMMRSHSQQHGGVSAGPKQRNSRTLLPLKQSQSLQPGSNASTVNGKNNNNFVSLALPYLLNSSSWHVREELMHVLIRCFLQSNSQFEFDSYAVLEALLKALDDQKERNRFIALEAIVAFGSIGNKFSTKEIVFQLADQQISELVSERLEAAQDMNPYINASGTLELPYLDHIEQATQIIQQTRGREGLQSEPMRSTQNQMNQSQASVSKRGNSVRKVGTSISSLQEASASTTAKRTASANDRNQGLSDDTSPAHQPNAYLLQEQQRMAMQNALMVPQFNRVPEQHQFSQGHQTEYTRYYHQQHGSHSKGPGGFGGSVKQNKYPASRHNFRLSHEKAASAASHDFPSDAFLPELNKKQSKSIQHQTPIHDAQRSTNFQNQSFYNQNMSVYSAHPSMLENQNPVNDQINAQNYEQYYEQLGGNLSPANNTISDMLFTQGSEQRQVNSRKPSSGSMKTAGHFTHYQMTPLQQSMNSATNNVQATQAHNLHSSAVSRGSHLQSAGSATGPDELLRVGGPSWANLDPNDIGLLANAAANFGAGGMNSSSQMTGQKQSRSGLHYAPTSSFQDAGISHQQIGANLIIQNQSVSSSAVPQFAQGTHSSSFTRKFSRGSSQNIAEVDRESNGRQDVGVRAVHFGRQDGTIAIEQPDGSVQFTPQIIRQLPQSQQKNGNAQSTTYSDGSMMTRETSSSTAIAANRLRKAKLGGGLIGTGQNLLSANQENNNEIAPEEKNEAELRPQRQPSATSSSRRGPVRATHKIVIKSSNDQHSDPLKQNTEGASRNFGPNDRPESQVGSKAELVIDSRKVKQLHEQKSLPVQHQQKFRDAYGIDEMTSGKETKLNNTSSRGSLANRANPYDEANQSENSVNSQPKERQIRPMKASKNQEEMLMEQTGMDARQYLTRDELEPVQGNQAKQFKKAIEDLKVSQDWNLQFDSCNIVRRTCMFHQDLVLQSGPTMGVLVKILVKLADSLRSYVSRISLMTINDLFFCLKRCMEPYLDPLVQILLKKGADTKSKFISEEADRALVTATENCLETKVLQVIMTQQVNSRSNQHRLRICRCLESLVEVLGNNILFFKDADKLVCQLARYISDQCQDVRQNAKRAFVILSQSIMGKNDLERLLVRVLNEEQYKKVRGYLDSEPQNFNYSQQSQSNLVITGATSTHAAVNKKHPRFQNKGTLRTGKGQLSSQNSGLNVQTAGNNGPEHMSVGGPLSGSGMGHHVAHSPTEELNIKATSIVNPKQRIKQIQKQRMDQQRQQQSESGLHSTKQSSFTEMSSDASMQIHGGNFNDSASKVVQAIYSAQHDWKARLEQMEALFTLIDQNRTLFQQIGTTNRKLGEVCDALCKLIGDQNLKIQVASLERFTNLHGSIKPFVEQNMTQIFLVLVANLASTNQSVKKASEAILESMYRSSPTGIFVTPLVNQIQFQKNARLKPTLIDHLSEFICESCSSVQLSKQVLPLAYKLIDDNRTEVRQRTDKLLRRIYTLIGQQVIDQCPQTKLQKVCDIVLNSGGGSAQASSTSQKFGAVGAANLVIMQAKTTQGKGAYK